MQPRRIEEFRPNHRGRQKYTEFKYTEVNFLKSLRGKSVYIGLLNGSSVLAKLKGWDRFHVFVERKDGSETMIFKHYIGEIAESD